MSKFRDAKTGGYISEEEAAMNMNILRTVAKNYKLSMKNARRWQVPLKEQECSMVLQFFLYIH